ncbi:hypothetical protein WKV53_16520 [Luteolibacter sp. Y139]|uniref:MoxR-vWA-beta-propeller ternary system domain-containing protein n=1 Tax=Luteolibacter soli TaxID=3135280 RepID=A0ABU9AX43_9BACT
MPPGREWSKVVTAAANDAGERQQAIQLLAGWHREAVLDLSGPPLPFHPAAAWWGAVMLFRAACLVCFREMEVTDIVALLRREPLPDSQDPAAHFSADLCLRHWPDLYRMARARSEDDPLVKAMHDLAKEIPLSAPGMHLAVEHPVLTHTGLRQAYAERALERADTTCLAQPAIASFVRSKLGAYTSELGRGLLSPATES